MIYFWVNFFSILTCSIYFLVVAEKMANTLNQKEIWSLLLYIKTVKNGLIYLMVISVIVIALGGKIEKLLNL